MIKRVLLCTGTLIFIFFVDKTGRRPMFFVAGTMTMSALMVMGGLGLALNPSRSIKEGIVAMSMLFPATYFPSFGAWYVDTTSLRPTLLEISFTDRRTWEL